MDSKSELLDIAQEAALPSSESHLPVAELEGNDRVKKLSARHYQIMEYLLMHPSEKLGSVAKRFGLTPPWLSSLINSDLFKQEFRARLAAMRQMNDLEIMQDMHGVVKVGIKKMKEHLEHEDCDPKTVNEYMHTALETLGYVGKNAAAASPVNVNVGVGIQNTNSNNVPDDVWAEAQAIMRQKHLRQ